MSSVFLFPLLTDKTVENSLLIIFPRQLLYLCTDIPMYEDEKHLSKQERQFKDIGESL